jgi:hypothetical protein
MHLLFDGEIQEFSDNEEQIRGKGAALSDPLLDGKGGSGLAVDTYSCPRILE